MKTSDFRIILKSDTIRNGPLTVLSDMPADAKDAIAKAFLAAHTADKAAFDKLSDGKNQPWKAAKTEEWKPVVELVQFVDSLRRKN
jgi:phosphonate transport system substrate-binding protein